MPSSTIPRTTGSRGKIIKRKTVWITGAIILCALGLWFLLNMETTTRQGINHETRELKIPLYLKLSNFLDRHWNYQWLVERIVDRQTDETQKVETIFLWTIKHIIAQPPQLPVVDDHVWHIIVRGYGTEDQVNDVFATLCNYAGIKAIIVFSKAPEGKKQPYISLSAVYLDGAWRLCDVSVGIKFINNRNKWATVAEVLTGEGKAMYYGASPTGNVLLDYPSYLQTLRNFDFDRLYRINRSSIQNPFARFLYFLRDRKL
jgi:hypothetical protein